MITDIADDHSLGDLIEVFKIMQVLRILGSVRL